MTKLIAEFCQNHNGDMTVLAKMVELAAKAGATHGKIQTIYADTVAFRPQFEEGVLVSGITKSIKRPYRQEFDRLKGLELSQEDTIKFIKICKDNGLIPMTTCFVRSHVSDLAQAGFPIIKVASYDCASFPLLRELTSHFEEIIVSTGATFDDEVKHAASILSAVNYSFLHCVTLYPTPLNQMNLLRMEWLRGFTKNVGLSDHTLLKRDGLIASKAALSLGASVIERHFTILGPSETRDGPVSITPLEMRQLADFSMLSIEERVAHMNRYHPNWHILLGEKTRTLSDEEILNRDYYRGRFASPRRESVNGERMIFNWEETPIV